MSYLIEVRGRDAFPGCVDQAYVLSRRGEGALENGPSVVPRPALLYIANSLFTWDPLAKRKMTAELRRQMEPCDATQEAYLKALRSQETLRGEGNDEANAWFHSILLRTIKDLIRAVRTERRGAQELILSLSYLLEAIREGLVSSESEPLSHAPAPEMVLSSEEALQRIMSRVAEFEETTYRLLVFVLLMNRHLKEAAEDLGLNPVAASSRLCRARKELRGLLRKRGL